MKVELLFVVGDDLVEAVELAAFALVSDGWAERVVDAALEVGGLLVDEGHVAVGPGDVAAGGANANNDHWLFYSAKIYEQTS